MFSTNDNKINNIYVSVPIAAQPFPPITVPIECYREPSPLIHEDGDVSPLCQIDGNDSPPTTPGHGQVFSLPPVYTTQTTSDNFSGPGTSSRIRSVSYSLDRTKQVKRLGHDATTGDFTIVVSKNKENVNIDCNVGFYTTVAVPAIQHLAASQLFVCQGVSVHCQDVVGTFDATKAQQNTVIFFRLSSKDKSSLGCVRIHLHHTTRKVQLQGGALISGEQKAPIWFVEHVLRDNFAKLSQEKATDIRNFNQAVSRSLTSEKLPSTCAGCDGQFNGRSNPAFCKECKSFYHKFKCFPTNRHPCYQNKSTQSVVTVPAQPGDSDARPAYHAVPVTNHQQTNDEVQSQVSDFRRTNTGYILSEQLPSHYPPLGPIQSHLEAPPQPADPVLLPPGNVPLLPQLQPRDTRVTEADLAINPVGSAVNTADSSDIPISSSEAPPRLNPNATPFIIATPSTQTPGARKKNKKKNTTIPTDQDGVQLEFTKMEISTLQAKLQKQETDLKDLQFRNEILMARNKSLEEAKKREIHDQYFPSHSNNHVNSQPSQPSQPSSNHPCPGHQNCRTPCFPHPPCWTPGCMHHCMSNVAPRSDGNPNTDINRVVLDLKLTSDSLQTTLDRLLSYLSSTTPTPTNTEDINHTSPEKLTEAMELPSQDISTISLDGFMFTENDSEIDLN